LFLQIDNELVNEAQFEEEAIIKENHVLKVFLFLVLKKHLFEFESFRKFTIEDDEKNLEHQLEIVEKLKEFYGLQNMLRTEMKNKVELQYKYELIEADIEDLKKLRHFYSQFPLNEPILNENSYQMYETIITKNYLII
jgi:hypothetical protein